MEHELALLEAKFKAAESDEQRIESLNTLVGKFPLLFGYWLKLIDISRDKERDWARALEQCPVLELWVAYLNSPFGSSVEAAREATKTLGYHFQAHPLWDQLLRRTNNDPNILRAVLKVPLYSYAQYLQLAFEQNLESPEKLQIISQELAGQVTRKYEFESKIKRPYFHPHELHDEELRIWEAYLDYTEQATDNTEEILQLYERCLVSTAYYPSYWLRYIRWLTSHVIEDVRACRSALRYHNKKVFRLLYSRALETSGEVAQARDQLLNPDDVKELVEFDRRHNQQPDDQGRLYNIEYAQQTGDLSLVPPQQLHESPEIFRSQHVDPKALFPLWERKLCPDPRQYAERLKDSGALREFFLVDSTLGFD